jgi:dUTP pyrophosphatase
MSVKYGIGLANSTGIIDSDYVEELFVPVYNMGDTPITIYHGDRIAQALLEEVKQYTLVERKSRPEQKTERAGGLGSTGTN